ncbi:hypothetical protein [Rubrivivax gelatinosus]|uniref:hypothetical protein n=1 Tax=Rubrivivax gelatinosus TaxID=28068 RepID=UPI00104DA73B|nr:hypothetical protein [Rubrivivax gelatinosus]MBK1688888.1 hypothetical protein [Rubrivivax gelatinosus]
MSMTLVWEGGPEAQAAFDRRPDPELWVEARDFDRERRRAVFLADLVGGLLPSVAGDAFDACVAAVGRELKEQPGSGLEPDAATAWVEAAMIVQAGGHLLFETLVCELQMAARRAFAALDRRQRLMLGCLVSQTSGTSTPSSGTSTACTASTR